MLVSEKSLRYLIIGGRRERAGDQINRRVGGIFVKFNKQTWGRNFKISVNIGNE